ncbi:hypothetical protein DRO61_02840 [Candidatus Bathyarchaeota archaeon]|jgi:putative ABC transport system permease protein|nr:MAG: hypothetical protein DRO61_02840 [Candidatus Bathyarchaeota archaeon]
MNMRDIGSYAFDAIRLRKFRTGLTTLGIVIGIAAIVALLSLGQGFQNVITEQIETGFATNTLTVTTQGFGMGQSGSDIPLFVNDTQRIDDELEDVQISMAVIQKTCILKIGEDTFQVIVRGVDFSKYASVYNTAFIAEEGTIPQNPDDEMVIIGAMISNPGGNGSIIRNVNDQIELIWTTRSGFTIKNETYTGTIVAVLSEIGGFGMSGPSDTGVYIPISKAQSFFNTNETNTIIVQLTNSDEETIENVSEAIKNIFNDKVQVISPTAILNIITTTFSTIELFLAGIAGISLLVAGIGIMNIMIVSLMERTREIGILKALGMKNRTVLSIFLSESVIVGLIGTAIGIVLGWVLAIGASKVLAGFSGGQGGFGGGQMMTGGMPISPVVTSTVILGAFAFGLIITVIFALYPAWRASRLKPVEALRSE